MLNNSPERLLRRVPAHAQAGPAHHPLLQADLSDAVKLDPFEAYRELRNHPVAWSPGFFGGGWVLSRHADVSAALKSPHLSAQRTAGWVNSSGVAARRQLGPLRSELAQALLFMDAPGHAALRALLRDAFTQCFGHGWIEQARRVVERVLPRLLAEAGSEFDWMTQVANRLPARVMIELLGVHDAPESDFLRWARDIVAFIDNPAPDMPTSLAAQDSVLALNGFFRDWLRQQRGKPSDDILGTLLRLCGDRSIDIDIEEETLDTLAVQAGMLLFAGYETTRNLLGNGLWLLLSHPEQWQRLCSDPALVVPAVRECLRLQSPVQLTARRVARACEIGGQKMHRGELVIALIGSANRDEAVFPEPEHFDIARSGAPHIAFGQGVHVCIGAALTGVEAETVFGHLARHASGLRLACPGQPPAWRAHMVYRALQNLPVRMGPACAS